MIYIFVMVVFGVVSMALLTMMFLVSMKMEMSDNVESVYECGFDPSSMTRQTFSYRFFLIAILFLIFDVEISLMLPLPYVMLSDVAYVVLFWFLVILVGGLLYEMWNGVLDWVSVAKA